MLGEIDGRVILEAAHESYGYELSTLDSGSRNIRLLRDIWPGPQSSSVHKEYETAEGILLYAQTETGSELWTTDGTDDGTYRLGHFDSPFPYSPNFYYFKKVNNRLIFLASYKHEDGNLYSLWEINGAEDDVRLIADLQMIDASHDLSSDHDSELHYFTTYHPNPYRHIKLWATDGTREGTRKFHETNESEFLSGLVLFDNLVSSAAFLERNPSELWGTDGTKNGTTLLSDFGWDDAMHNLFVFRWATIDGTAVFAVEIQYLKANCDDDDDDDDG